MPVLKRANAWETTIRLILNTQVAMAFCARFTAQSSEAETTTMFDMAIGALELLRCARVMDRAVMAA